jgi:hypothetical protein
VLDLVHGQVRPTGGSRTRREARPAIRPTPVRQEGKPSIGHAQVGLSYRLIGRNLGLSKNTVMEIVRREGV